MKAPTFMIGVSLSALLLFSPAVTAQTSAFDPQSADFALGTEGTIRIVHLGPYTVPAGRVVGGRMLPGEFDQFVQAPSLGDGYLTAYDSRVVDTNRVPLDPAEMYLHHAVLINRAASDLTCSLLGGERFAAAGAERIPFALPEGYGYPLRASNTIMCNLHLQNFTTVQKAVYYQFSMTTRPLAANLIAVRPWWLDIVTCLSSYTVTAGTGTDVRQTDVTVPMRLRVLTAGPHLHCGGTQLELLDRTNNYATIFAWTNQSCPVQMSSARPNPPVALNLGTTVTIRATYPRRPTEEIDAMGIILAYVVIG